VNGVNGHANGYANEHGNANGAVIGNGYANGHSNGQAAYANGHAGGGTAVAEGEFVQSAGRTLEEIERDIIVRTLGRFNGHRQKTARSLGIGVRTLGLKLKKWKDLRLVPATL